MSNRTQGLIGEAMVLSHFLKEGYEVFLPFDGQASFDLVLYKEGNFSRVSVKSTGNDKGGSSWKVELRQKFNRTQGNPFLNKETFDILAVYIVDEDRVVTFHKDEITTTTTLTIPKLPGDEAVSSDVIGS